MKGVKLGIGHLSFVINYPPLLPCSPCSLASSAVPSPQSPIIDTPRVDGYYQPTG